MKSNIWVDYPGEELIVEAEVSFDGRKYIVENQRVFFRTVEVTAELSMHELLDVQEKVLESYQQRCEDRRAVRDDFAKYMGDV